MHKRTMVLGLFLFALDTVFETIATGSVYPLISTILNKDGLFNLKGQGFVLEALFNLKKQLPFSDEVIASAALVLIFSVLSALFSFSSEFFAKFQQLNLYEVYRNRIFKLFLSQPYSYFLNKKQGHLIFLGTNIANSAGEFFVFFPKTVVEILRICAFSLFLMSISLKATLLVFFFIGIFALVFLKISSSIIYPRAQLMHKYSKEGLEIFTESLSGIREIKTFNAAPFFLDKFKEKNYLEKFHYLRSNIFSISFKKIFTVLAMVMVASVIIYSKWMGDHYFIQIVPLIAVFAVALQKMIPAISNLSSNWMSLKELTPRLEQLFALLSEEANEEKQGGKTVQSVGDIKLKEVCFSYDGIHSNLKNISLTIPEKNTIAFVGSSGSGKTTLVNLLVRLFTPTSGQIVVDGLHLDEISLKSWRDNIAIVNQDTFLFHASIFDNIRMSNPEATMEEVIEVSKKAYAHDFIQELESGYNTILGDKGMKLSGGQKQRIAIARALLKRPKILFLDEATSALDNISEKQIKDMLKDLKGELTVIVIAHRLSTVIDADKIFVLEKGRLIEEGSHQELLNRQAHYFNLYRTEAEIETVR